MKRQSTERDKIFANLVSDKELLSRIHKMPTTFNKKINNPIKIDKGPE